MSYDAKQIDGGRVLLDTGTGDEWWQLVVSENGLLGVRRLEHEESVGLNVDQLRQSEPPDLSGLDQFRS